VRVGRPRGSLQHLADEGEVRGGPIEGGRWRKWSSLEEWTCGGGNSRFIALDGGSNCRAGQMVMSCRREDGGVICLGWCHAVEGEQKRGTQQLLCQSREVKNGGGVGPAWVCHVEKKRKGPCGTHTRGRGGGGAGCHTLIL
jgi:hypothetical protein